jgi:hypothetical protein
VIQALDCKELLVEVNMQEISAFLASSQALEIRLAAH